MGEEDAVVGRRRVRQRERRKVLGVPYLRCCACPPFASWLYGGMRADGCSRVLQLGRPLDLDTPVPASIDNFGAFGPSFTLDVPAGNMRDRNTEETLSVVEAAFAGYVAHLAKRYAGK